MNLLELLYHLSETANTILYYIFTRDYSILSKKIFGVSLVDFAALIIAMYTTFEVIKFFLKLTSKLVGAILRTTFSHIAITVLLYLRLVLLRAKATVIYLWELDVVQDMVQSITQRLQRSFHTIFSRS